jgi:hypothetical protein
MGRNSPDQTRGKALDLWQAPAGAGEPLVCVVTTFTFDAAFFETECVGRFLQMDTHPSESDAVGYLIEREEKLAAAKVCALVDRRHARDKESLRWDVLGVLVPKAIQHAKVALLVWGNHARVIIGSGNLTDPGYRKNLEVFGTIELSKTDGGDRNSIEKTIEFLEQVVNLAVGSDGPHTPKERVRHALAVVRRHVDTWPTAATDIRTAIPIFGLPGRSVLKQFSAEWPGDGPARTASVASPFFDSPGHDRHAINALVMLMAKKRPRDLYFDIRAEDLPDGRIRLYAPLGMLKSARQACDVHVRTILPLQQEEVRYVHAKLLRLENDHWQMLLAGSSNFTAAGLGAVPGHGNFEANLVYRIKTSDPQFQRFERLWPDRNEHEVDLDSPKLIWDPEPEELEGGSDTLPLPACFQDAIFEPGKNPSLRISLTPDLPQSWSIRIPNGHELLGTTLGSGPGQHVIEWMGQPVPFVLEVSWVHDDQTAVANWPVNVSNPGALPPPEALRDLTLEELLEILSSTRPLADAVVHVLRKRVGTPRIDVNLDPLTRLDSQAFLLRRTKRVAAALERLRERLERPALTTDAFEWRLRGAIGPITLADAFVREASLPGEAKFYLAELALALNRVRPERGASGGLSVTTIADLLLLAVLELEAKALALPSMSDTRMLDEYATEAFAEALGR